ncbi:MAG: hypothetical protein L3J66_07435 [Bacteroidales bacterium]|nr:hypothetical protein [Bacteroidales bacterium]
MKNLFYILLISAFFLGSCCGGAADSAANSKDQPSESLQGAVPPAGEAPDVAEPASETVPDKCSTFLDDYEAWANEYISLLDRFRNNPGDPNLAKDYQKVSGQMANWTEDWFDFVECSKQEDYRARYDAITKKIEEKKKALRPEA